MKTTARIRKLTRQSWIKTKAPKASTCSPTTNKLPATVPIPNEITLRIRILKYVREDDKQTLGRRMRVSPTFNALAAPLLYHSIVIETPEDCLLHPHDHFWRNDRGRTRFEVLDLPPAKAWLQRKQYRKVQGKEKDLDYVRNVTINDLPGLGTGLRFGGTPSRRTVLASVQTLRFAPGLSDRISHDIFQTDYTAISRTFPKASKLIIDHSFDDTILPHPSLELSPRIQTLVSVGRSRLLFRLGPLCDIEHAAFKTIVIIMLPTPMKLAHTRRAAISRLGQDLVSLDSLESFEGQMLLVNSESMKDKAVPEMTLQSYFKHAKDSTVVQGTSSSAGRDTTPEEEPSPKVRFLTMKEYLDTHDWTDELTEDDVRPFLDAP